MKKIKRILIVALAIFFVVESFFIFLLNQKKVSAQTDWLPGWRYRKPVAISNSGNNSLSDYQVLVTLNTASLISAGKMRSDCGDIRFTDSDGTTQLNYWLESECNSNSTIIWVKVPSIPAGSKTIYVYYGNPSATSASNGDNTFLFFDDFEGTGLNTNKWTWYNPNNAFAYSVSNSEIRIYTVTKGSGYKAGITKPNNFPLGIAVEKKIKGASFYREGTQFLTADASIDVVDSRYGNGMIYSGSPATNHGEIWYATGARTQNVVNYGSLSLNTYYINQFIVKPGQYISGKFLNLDRSVYRQSSEYQETYRSWTNMTRFTGLSVWHDSSTDPKNNDYYMDWILVRKYTSPEPTTSVGGEEETPICADHNVQGWAWSERIGWISFSCENCDSNLDGSWDGGECGTGPSVNYGVDINPNTGIISGYAWSEKAGWISFNSSDLNGCPSSPCEAKVDMNTGQISGWAKAINAIGWDPWIHLKDSVHGYGVYISNSNFKNWAWSDSVIGWISFNCKNCENNTNCDKTATCNNDTHPNYKVTTDLSFIVPPQVSNLRTTFSYCEDSLHPILSWDYLDEKSSGYKVEVYLGNNLIYQYEASNTESTSHTANYDPGICHPGENGFQISPCDFEYGKDYSWQVKAKDQNGVWSDWSSFSVFSTPSHSFPIPKFSWTPSIPRINEKTSFKDQTIFGTGALPSWSWIIPDANYIEQTNSSSQNPKVIFQTTGKKEVKLEAKDNTLSQEGNCGPGCCSVSREVYVRYSIPEWEEVHPGE